eukprot:3561126-Rhodomonas_salina.4
MSSTGSGYAATRHERCPCAVQQTVLTTRMLLPGAGVERVLTDVGGHAGSSLRMCCPIRSPDIWHGGSSVGRDGPGVGIR